VLTGRFEAGRWARAVVVACLIGGLISAAESLQRGDVVQRIGLIRKKHQRSSPLDFPNYDRQIDAIARILRRCPEDSEAHLLQAGLLIDRQRQRGAEDLVQRGLADAKEVAIWVSPRTVRRA